LLAFDTPPSDSDDPTSTILTPSSTNGDPSDGPEVEVDHKPPGREADAIDYFAMGAWTGAYAPHAFSLDQTCAVGDLDLANSRTSPGRGIDIQDIILDGLCSFHRRRFVGLMPMNTLHYGSHSASTSAVLMREATEQSATFVVPSTGQLNISRVCTCS
jgi:hypothetical protein